MCDKKSSIEKQTKENKKVSNTDVKRVGRFNIIYFSGRVNISLYFFLLK